MKDKYTLEQLNALPDAELDRLAAEVVMGWTFMKHQRWTPADYWVDGDLEERCKATEWHPTTDRNQSGKLLAKCVEKGARFSAAFNAEEPSIAFFQFLPEETQRVRRYGPRGKWNPVPSNGPRSETIAAILAAQAVEEGR